MRILYICTQRPGVGGAATETYEAIKRLRGIGCRVVGLFVVTSRAETKECDPDGIGNIHAIVWRQERPPQFDVRDFDIIVGKNYESPVVGRYYQGIPNVFLTSGIDYVSKLHCGAAECPEPPPADGVDLAAWEAADYVLVHSTIDWRIYDLFWPEPLLRKRYGEIVYTPNIAVRPIDPATVKPYQGRQFDLAFSASNWDRHMKNGPLMRRLCEHYKRDRRILVCGRNEKLHGVTAPGLVPHAAQIDMLKDARIVVIPSLYDPSPNLYAEAALCGCNIVTNPNVGNCEGHPAGLRAGDLSFEAFVAAIDRALALRAQEHYRTPTPEWATWQLADRLQQIIRHHKGN